MNTFNKKSLYAALAGLGALGATGAAQAVNVNPDGLGQVLIYPYYTVRTDTAGNAFNTLLSVVNSTNSAKAVKVRFLEGKNSREVLDFNLFLSPYDVWTAAIIPSPITIGARVITADKSCTLPPIPLLGQDFVNYAYLSDNGGNTLDRTKEGYIEIIEMATYTTTSITGTNITHVNGTPPGCPLHVNVASLNDTQAGNPPGDALPIGGGLFGGASLINVNSGVDYTEDAVALDNFFAGTNYNSAGVTTPDLTQTSPPVSLVVAAGASGVYSSIWVPGTADPVSAILIHDNVLNEYVLDSGSASGTDWVVTFPTKRFYINTGTGLAPKLFQRNFNTTVGSCDDVSLNLYDREELTTINPATFSPPPPSGVNQLCWEANVLTFTNGGTVNLLGSVNLSTINIQNAFGSAVQNGWLKMGFFPATITGSVHRLINTLTTLTPVPGTTGPIITATYMGLPLVGFAVQSFSNGTVPSGGKTVLSNYGGNFVHKTTRLIQ